MYLLDLFQAKLAFLFMVAALIIIPAWILIVAFTKKKGKADSVNNPAVGEEKKEAMEKTD